MDYFVKLLLSHENNHQFVIYKEWKFDLRSTVRFVMVPDEAEFHTSRVERIFDHPSHCAVRMGLVYGATSK